MVSQISQFILVFIYKMEVRKVKQKKKKDNSFHAKITWEMVFLR